MAEKNIKEMNDDALHQIQQIVETSTVIGDPIKTQSGTTILPVCKINVGYGLGGMEFSDEKEAKKGRFAGGTGGGLSMTPVAFLTVSPTGGVSLLQVADKKQGAERALNLLPGLMQQVSDLIEKKTGISIPSKNKAKEESGEDWENYIRDMPIYEETVIIEEE